MPASVWTGTLSFGLVSVPVKIFTATTSHNIGFNLLHEECLSRIKYQYYCPHHERVVERSELVKGYEHEKNEFIVVEDDELEKIKPASSSHLDVVQFIDISEVDPIYFEKTYYLGPDKGAEKTFTLLTKAMEETNKAAVGKLTMRNHEYLALIRPGLDGMVVHFMLYEDEIRENTNKVKKNPAIRPKELDLAKQLVENLSEPFDPSKFKDEYVERVEDLIEAKVSGRKLRIVKPKAKPKIDDLMKALQRSVEETRKGARTAKGRKLKKSA